MAAHAERQDKPGGKSGPRKLVGALLLISLVLVIFGGAVIANLNAQAQPKQALTSDNSRGFRATPAFLVNAQVYAGPPSYEQLSQLIDSNLKQ